MRIAAQRTIFTVCKSSTTNFTRLNLPHHNQNQCRPISSTASLHAEGEASTSAARAKGAQRNAPRGLRRTQEEDEETLWDLDEVEDEDVRHMSGYGWDIHRQQKEFFDYMRILQRDVPVLEQFRRPFHPPSPSQTPVLVRTVTYAGEPNHPVTRKRTIVVPLSRLPLKNDEAIHNFKVIAGTRWTMEMPKDSGLPSLRHQPVYASDAKESVKQNDGGSQSIEDVGKHGYIKISSEDFPSPDMNLKWAMDVLNKLVREANDRSSTPSQPARKPGFLDIPLPTRHHTARLRAQGLGGGSLKAERKRVTLADFPQSWLPR